MKWYDFLSAILITGLFSFLGSLLAVPFGFFTIFIAPVMGTITEFVVRKVISNRRSPLLYKVVGVTAFVAALPVIVVQGVAGASAVLNFGVSATGRLFPFIWVVIYGVIITSTVYYRFTN